MCGVHLESPDYKFCPTCGAPVSGEVLVKHSDALDQFSHHETVLQNYRSMFLVSETFAVSLAATRLDNRGLVTLFALFGISLLVVWIAVTELRARVVKFFEEHDEEGALMRYHDQAEGIAHRAGLWVFTIALPSMFAVFWAVLILLAYGVI
jgi:predicted amidophosphoribosyltransferase